MSPRMLAELAYLYAVEAMAVERAAAPDWLHALYLRRFEHLAWRQAQAGGYRGHGGADELFGARCAKEE